MYNSSMSKVSLPVILSQGEDGFIVAEVPIIPGCISQGATVAEALVNIREAAELCLETREAEGWQLPTDYFIEQIEVSA
jgi:predicted RNase H-like HicB family nuclease